MPPTKILLIRHAEKPAKDGTAPFGVNIDGEPSLHSLVVRGWYRAGALIRFFCKPEGLIDTPTTIFAATPDTTRVTPHGERPSQTVTPLAAYLETKLDLRFGVGDEAALAAAVLSSPGVVLICWEHHAISDIVRALGLPAFSKEWPDRFDLVWVMTQAAGSWTLEEATQGLLSGDSQG